MIVGLLLIIYFTRKLFFIFIYISLINLMCTQTFMSYIISSIISSIIIIFNNSRYTNLNLKCFMRLPNVTECQPIPSMPNTASPSDHLPLFAVFSYPIK